LLMSFAAAAWAEGGGQSPPSPTNAGPLTEGQP
jgi:hypothetical protein